MRINRRHFFDRTAQIAIVAAMFSLTPNLSHAFSVDDATAHVQVTIDEVSALVDSAGDTASKAATLREIMERRAAMPQIARFAAGSAWRGMNEDQQARFVAAFSKFVSGVYAARFQDYATSGNSAKSFKFGTVIDAGRKGILVKTTITRTGEAPVNVEWLVSDQPGHILIADIVIEGVSMLVTQREEIGGMLEARRGDVEKLIADLSA